MAKSPIVIGVYWDQWSPKVMSSVLMDLLQLATNGMCGKDTKVYVWSSPDSKGPSGAEDMRSAILASGLALADDSASPPDHWLAYYQTNAGDLPDLPTTSFFQKGRRHFKCMTPKKKELVMRPDSPNYPAIPERYRLAPPSANPLTRPRPPRNSDTTFLPPWAVL